MQEEIQECLTEFQILKVERQRYEPLWRDISIYIQGVDQEFYSEALQFDDQKKSNPGNTKTWTTHGIKANKKMSSALKGELWPEGGANVKIKPTRSLKVGREEKEYFEHFNGTLREILGNPEIGLDSIMDEYFNDQTAYGNGGVALYEDDETDLRFEFWPIRNCFIAEDKYGFINRIYRIDYLSLYVIVERYGLKNLSPQLQEKYKTERGKFDKHQILIVIKPNKYMKKNKKGLAGMSYSTYHIEFETKHPIKKGGLEELNVFFSRFMKRSGRGPYGEGAGGDALPEVKELSFCRYSVALGIEKTIEPPLLVENDALLGNVIDSSPNAINVVESGNRTSDNPIRPMQIVGDLNIGLLNIEELKKSIDDHFQLDKLLDFNNESEMTLGEVKLRDQIRGRGMNSIYSRQHTELFYKMVTMAVNVLFKRGRLGVVKGSPQEQALVLRQIEPIYVPDSIVKLIVEGSPFYQIEFTTPAAKVLKASKGQSLNSFTDYTVKIGTIDQSVLMSVDWKKMNRQVAELEGVEEVILTDEEFDEKMKEVQAQQQAEQDRLNAEVQAKVQSSRQAGV